MDQGRKESRSFSDQGVIARRQIPQPNTENSYFNACAEKPMENALVAIDVARKHTHKDEPIRLVSALDGDRYEVRKLEFFRDGSVGFADETGSSPETELGTVPMPSLIEINADPEFEAQRFRLKYSRHYGHAMLRVSPISRKPRPSDRHRSRSGPRELDRITRS
ncbi:DUF6881 domain-containing protein [Burkholderia territorii]|uniref:DUF6881 domain-containing protein n=1 Tax=Burkholderia territorii TaxID=1503055 RepID=A0A6L3NNA4_9BURK|nr:hypothetical protein [Burkholderia territorii]KAB0685286.1 hypothetical protein F7R13_05165 [Burkholderia territorii]MBM2774416.1 hypothetical protein [Burkholderia territorii]